MRYLGTLEERKRERELAGDQRAGVWSRGLARRKQHDFLRRNWHRLTLGIVMILGPAVAAAAVTGSDLVRGLILGAATVGAPGLVWHMTVLSTGTAPTVMGDFGEQSTAGELRALRRRGWRMVNHLVLAHDGDVDHVLVGPGGAFAVETKWSAQPWGTPDSDPRIGHAAAHARRCAKRLTLWHPFRSRGTRVDPVVILWGGGADAESHWDVPRELGGVLVVHGRFIKRWTRSLRADVIEPAVVDALWAELDGQVRRRDEAIPDEDRIPRSGWEIVAPVAVGVGSAALSLVLLASLWGTFEAPHMQVGIGLVLTTAAAAARASRLWPALAWGALVGCGLPTLALTLAILAEWVRAV